MIERHALNVQHRAAAYENLLLLRDELRRVLNVGLLPRLGRRRLTKRYRKNGLPCAIASAISAKKICHCQSSISGTEYCAN